MMQDVHKKLNPGLPSAEAAFKEKKKKTFFKSKLDLNLRNQLAKCYIWSITLCGAETGHFGKQIRNGWHVLKCGAGEVWRRSVGRIV